MVARPLAWRGAGVGAALLLAGRAAAQEAAPAPPPAADSRALLLWSLLALLVLVGLVFVLLFTLLVVKMQPQLRKLYALPTVHNSWSGKVVGLLVGDNRLVTGELKDELMGHEYDGIAEYDNDLPPWWKYGFALTVVFAAGYLGYYQVAKAGPNSQAEYETEMRQATLLLSADADDPNKLTTYTALKTPADLSAGKGIFATNCAPCHGPDAEGKVGPNLTDEYWLHGGELNHVYKTIKFGVQGKGMVAWKGKLSGKQILQVASYVQSLQNSKPANAKEPQGEKEGH
ncbi:MAG: c-type cytochrome [Hymenobacter sp.]|nr:MAG: c-type cytochrome [Hymenobacter sp.]